MSGPAGQDEAAEKSHEPTQRKLDEARRQGDIPRSADLTTAAAYAGFVLAGLAAGPASLQSLGTTLSVPLGQADGLARAVFGDGQGTVLLGGFGGRLALAVLPWFAGPAALALLAVIAQQALVVAPDKLVPKLSRLSPLQSLKQKFGRAGLFEFAKSFAKLALYSVILFWYILDRLPRLIATVRLEPGQIAVELLSLCLGLLLIVLAVALALGGLDLLFQRADHRRRNMMSRKELMDELKESEGDPMLKAERRQKGVAIAMNRMLAEVPQADVVIVNPTHYAVALKWDRGSGRAPVCVAKGRDRIAARIREITETAGVPIRSDPPTARALFAAVEIGEEIRRDHYRAVAAAIRFAEAARRSARR